MDQARFLEACRWALSGEGAPQGIGTLGEKALHRAVKYYFQPDSQQREVPVPPYVADAVTPEGILEVQTRSFQRLRPKLQAFLSQGPVTVVYPVPAKKTVAWLTEEGEVTPAHKSPLKPTAGSVLPELYQLGELLFHPNLRLCVLLLEVEEYRLLKRLVFDGASHLQVAREFHITVYASEKRLERIRDKLSAVFPGRRRKKRKKVEKDCQESS